MSPAVSRAVVIGHSGQVAAALRDALASRGARVLSTSSRAAPGIYPLDLADPASIRACFSDLERELPGPGVELFLCGALTHVDRCETERDLCRRMNEEGPGLVAEECRRLGWRLSYFSSEYVFGQAEYEGGRKGPFSEHDPAAPSSYYGECKRNAEERVLQVLGGRDALVVRTTMVFSYAPGGMNFFMQVLRHLRAIRAGADPAPFRVPLDQISTPTYAPHLAEATLEMREREQGGIVHLVGTDLLSRREFVERVAREFGFDPAASLAAFRFLPTSELGQKARRPLSAGLRTDRAKAAGISVRSLADAFADVKRRMEAEK